ncbi:hypothetical protein [Colwellia piezophila]|uniref:hypothetical protein n=1 Tax=Colwellia piezophila TaxID=211668 RepID=UPI00038266B6|nr:hypothetical protein [Colwellia piezophila]
MKNNSLTLYAAMNWLTPPPVARVQKKLSMLFIACLISLTSACQMPPPATNDSENYSQYYLGLKNLTDKGLLAEEKHLKILINNKYREDIVLNQGKLILIYSLPNSNLHHPYKAKRLLNEYLLSGDSIAKENFAFIMVLRDQLNSQLHLLASHKAHRETCKKESDEHHLLIEQLQQQLKLLKQIDQNINERG